MTESDARHWLSDNPPFSGNKPWRSVSTYMIASGDLLYDTGNQNWCSVPTKSSGLGWEMRGRLKKDGCIPTVDSC